MASKPRLYTPLKKYRPIDQFAEYFHDHEYVLNEIHNKGFAAFFIGGCVRDSLLAKRPYDFDIATSATPQQIKDIFDHVIDTGIKFGTVSVMSKNICYQVTTFRKESGYVDNRKPEVITFSNSLYQDVLRRDFTINTLAYDGAYIIDYFNALDDLQKKVIKTVGSGSRRFKEDALRILRAARFKVTLGFVIEEKTKESMRKYAYLLKNISKERVSSELYRIIEQAESLEVLFDTDIAENIFIYPKLINQGPLVQGKYLVKLVSVFEKYNDTVKIKEELTNLKIDNKTAKIVSNVLQNIETKTDECSLRRLIASIKEESVRVLLEYKKADMSILEKIIRQGYIEGVNNLDISGHDIMELGYGKEDIRSIKKMLFEQVVCDISINKKELLIDLIKDSYDNQIVKQS